MSGVEWIVEAYGCPREVLQDLTRLRALFDAIIAELALHPVGDILWHRFPDAGGITGMALLSESHLTCHTFPEHGSICLNLFSCRPRPRWDFEGRLRACLGADRVEVQEVARDYMPAEVAAP